MVTEAPAGRWLEYLPLSVLEAAEANPKDHADGAIAESIDRFGFIETPVIDERTGRLVAGHGRTADLRRREALGEPPADGIVLDEGSGVWLVPVVRGWRSADDDEALAAGIALNRTGELGGWKVDTLAEVLARVERTDRGFDGVGFATSNLDELLATVSGPAPAPARKAPVVNRDPDDAPDTPADPLSRLGTVWRLGPHRLVCADSTKPAAYELLGLEGPAALVWTDPPYGVSYVGKTADALTIESDALSPDELREQLLRPALSLACEHTALGGGWFVAAPAGALFLQFALVLADLSVWRQTLVWVKDSIVLGHSDYHYRHEALFYGWRDGAPPALYEETHDALLYGWRPGAPHTAPPDRRGDTIWEFPRPKRSSEHPTMKPTGLIARALVRHSKPDDLILDPFGGSGSTLIAAHLTDRRAALIELDPRYVDVICRRYQELTGVVPHNETLNVDVDFTKE